MCVYITCLAIAKHIIVIIINIASSCCETREIDSLPRVFQLTRENRHGVSDMHATESRILCLLRENVSTGNVMRGRGVIITRAVFLRVCVIVARYNWQFSRQERKRE